MFLSLLAFIHTHGAFVFWPLMGFEPSQEGRPFMNVSIRCWIRIRSQKQTERFRKHFRRMGTGLGGRVGRWYSTDVGVSVLPASSGILAPSCHLQGQRPGCRGGQQWCSHRRSHQDGRSEPPHWCITAARDRYQPALHGRERRATASCGDRW